MVPTPNDGQYEGLRKLVDEKNPKVIGINESDAWNHADGITANEKRRLRRSARAAHAPDEIGGDARGRLARDRSCPRSSRPIVT